MSRLLENYNNYITFEFGEQELWGSPIFHDGIDIVGETEDGGHIIDNILNHTSGTVIESDYDEGRGNHICVQVTPTAYMTYNHLEDLMWNVGDTIQQGEIIGLMGRSGNCTGYHLHWGINECGEWINPEPYLDIDYISNPTPTETMCDEVRVAYVDVLDRMPDESGFGNYTNYLANGGTVDGMYEGLKDSGEYRNIEQPNLEGLYFVLKCYEIILGRLPENLNVAKGWIPIDNTMENKIRTFNAIWLSDEAKERRENS